MKILALLLIVGSVGLVLAQNPPEPTAQPTQEVPAAAPTPAVPAVNENLRAAERAAELDTTGKAVPPAQPQQVPPTKASTTDGFIYDPTGRRDPFQPDVPKTSGPEIITGPEVVPSPESGGEEPAPPARSLEPLECCELNQFRVGAIIWNTRNPKAMIIDPSGGVHFVKLKTRIGKRNGFVAAIREGEVVVVEYVQENGQYTKTFKVLELR